MANVVVCGTGYILYIYGAEQNTVGTMHTHQYSAWIAVVNWQRLLEISNLA